MDVVIAESKMSLRYRIPRLLLFVIVLPVCNTDTKIQADLEAVDMTTNQSIDLGSSDAIMNVRVDMGTPDSNINSNHSECGDESLTQWEQKMLEAHNRWRASVEPPAANMYRVYWDTNSMRSRSHQEFT